MWGGGRVGLVGGQPGAQGCREGLALPTVSWDLKRNWRLRLECSSGSKMAAIAPKGPQAH